MQKNNFRTITEEELKAVNTKIAMNFGARNKITSGSCEISDGGLKKYNISIENIFSHHPRSLIKSIGEYVKNIWQADEVYYFGVKVA